VRGVALSHWGLGCWLVHRASDVGRDSTEVGGVQDASVSVSAMNAAPWVSVRMSPARCVLAGIGGAAHSFFGRYFGCRVGTTVRRPERGLCGVPADGFSW
jgi:hypothetical protein